MIHPIENIMRSTMEELKAMVDVNTILGTPIAAGDETMILPVSKVTLGFLSGGGEYGNDNEAKVKKSGEQMDAQELRYPFAGTAIAAMSLTPIAFLSVNKGAVRVLPAQYKNSSERAVELIPEALCMAERLLCNCCNTDSSKENKEQEN